MSTGTSSVIAAVAPPSNFAGFSQEGTVIDGRAWDIFSLGMTLLYAWRGTRWWPKLSPFQMANALVDKGVDYRSNMWGKRDDSFNLEMRRKQQLDKINNLIPGDIDKV